MNSPQGKWPKKGWQIQVHFGRKCAFLASLNQHPSTQKRSKNVFSHVSFFCPWSKPSPALRHPLSIRAIVNGIPLTKKNAPVLMDYPGPKWPPHFATSQLSQQAGGLGLCHLLHCGLKEHPHSSQPPKSPFQPSQSPPLGEGNSNWLWAKGSIKKKRKQ